MAEKRFLVVIETQRVKGYLFASPILRETRGASLLLDRLNRVSTEELLTGNFETVYLGGGSGRILFESEGDAERFAQAVRHLYRERTWNASVSAVVAERGQDHEGRDEPFAAWMSRGVRESRQNKLARIDALPVLGGRWIRPCSSCGKEPAHQVLTDVQGSHDLCTSCWQKRNEVSLFYHGAKRNWNINVPIASLATLRNEWRNSILTTLSETIASDQGAEQRLCLPQDLNQIGAHSKPQNYIGFIYADGNRMGETIKCLGREFPDDVGAKSAYRAFSAIVDEATREAAVRAVIDYVGPQSWQTLDGQAAQLIPAEFVLAGGDDLILIVPAHCALAVAARFIARYQAKTIALQDEWKRIGRLPGEFAPRGLTTSAGVVIAHASYPASQLMELATDLMKFAKRKAADLADGGRIEGTLDFAVLYESGSEKLKERRKKEYRCESSIRRTERPYTATGAFRLLERIRALKSSGLPRTKLKALYPIVFEDPVLAQFEARRILERLKSTGALQQGTPLADLCDELKHFPFRENESGLWTTPLSELIELYDFVQEERGKPGEAGRAWE